MPEPKLWKRAEKILSQCHQGRRLCRLNRQTEAGETEVVYFLEPGGRKVGRASAENAIIAGGLKPANDGLFDGFSQTWGMPLTAPADS